MTREEMISAIESMTVLELNELVKALEEKFGVSAAAPVAVAAAAPAAAFAECEENISRFDLLAHLDQDAADDTGLFHLRKPQYHG